MKLNELITLKLLTRWARISKVLYLEGMITEYQMKLCHTHAITGTKKCQRKYADD